MQIKDGAAVRAAVPLLGVEEKERLNCYFEKAAPPAFRLSFPYGTLAMEQVDTSRPCMVMIDFQDQALTVSADIHEIANPQTLELIARETVNHGQSRKYFRVDAATRVAASSALPEPIAPEGENWTLYGDTIDLSGSGLLCSFSEPIENGKKVRIELTLPIREMDVIKAFGHVVRCRKIEEHLYHVALHFDLIDSDSQDKIMACCFELQRKYLRMRVQIAS
jgi:c-di-GMP-binding flagellar brake protein YcgR